MSDAKDVFQFVGKTILQPLDLKHLHEYAIAMAEHLFLKNNSAPPLWFVGCSRTGQVDIVATYWEDEPQKAAVVHVLRAAMKSLGCDLYSQIGEVWMANVTEGMDRKIADLMPSEREDRIEALMVSSCDKAGGGIFTRYVITPMPTGPKALGRREDLTGDASASFKGRMWNMLKED